jgi:hypothetical protein
VTVDKLFALLRSRTVNDDSAIWKVVIYPDFISVVATTVATAKYPREAWELADELFADVIDLGFDPVHTCRIGTTGKDVDEEDEAWRGTIDVSLTPRVEPRPHGRAETQS